MNKEQFHRYICESTGNESNICQIYAVRDGEAILDDCWRGFKTEDAMNVNSVTKGIMALLAQGGRKNGSEQDGIERDYHDKKSNH